MESTVPKTLYRSATATPFLYVGEQSRKDSSEFFDSDLEELWVVEEHPKIKKKNNVYLIKNRKETFPNSNLAKRSEKKIILELKSPW